MLIGLGRDGQQVKAGTTMKYQFAIGTFIDPDVDEARLEQVVRDINLGGGQEGYPVRAKTGALLDASFFLTLRASGNEAVLNVGPKNLMIDLPIRVQGVEDNGCAAVFSTHRRWFRFISVWGDTAYFQEPIDEANELWVGNVFLSDNKALKVTLIMDGQAAGKPPFLEIHNPTAQPVRAKVWSPDHTPVFGGLSATLDLPAGDSLRVAIDGKHLAPMTVPGSE